MTSEPENVGIAIAKSEIEKQRRLHPMSWMFVLLVQLRQFAVPLLILLFTGRGDRYEFYSLIGVVALAIYSVFQYFTYRYRVHGDELVVRSGVFQKSVRHIPFSRIQNVSITQNILHRLFNVAEVRLEAAGGAKAEAEMRVLSLADAHALEELIRTNVGANANSSASEAASSDASTLHSLSVLDVVKLGLINNRGMFVIGGAAYLLSQGAGNSIGKFIKPAVKFLFGWSDSLHLGTSATVLGILLLIVFFVVLLRVFSVVMALLQYHGFSLSQRGRRLTVQRGLLSRLRSSLPLRRIQAYGLTEGWLHRRFNKRSLKVDSAAGVEINQEDKSPLRDLVPLASPEEMDQLIARFLASDQWPIKNWQPLHDDAWKREFLIPASMVLLAAISGAVFYQAYIAWALLIIPVLFLRAKVWSAHAAFAQDDNLIAVREGWLSREWRFAEISKLQGLRLHEGILDRRYGMASLYLDTAGAQAMSSPFRIPYLPREQAEILLKQLSTKISRAPLPF
ncbi:MAG: PH domain-containing protein [Arenimonas sp.]